MPRASLTHARVTEDRMSHARNSLPPGTLLDCYRIRKLIGSGGFSLIYLAEDEDTGRDVVIKEFMPNKFACRDSQWRVLSENSQAEDSLNRGRKLFYQEAKILASLRHPNIVQVLGCFRRYDTGYIVMEYYRGQSLAAYIKHRQGELSTSFILRVFLPILDALNLIHSCSLLHLDVKPGNIQLRAGGEPLLLDFGAVHPFGEHPQERSGQVITAGYSPLEQYSQGGQVGPWSDVYAIGASIRACMDGKTPASAIERHAGNTLLPAHEVFQGHYPGPLLRAVDWAMEMDPQRRPQHAGELLNALRRQARRNDMTIPSGAGRGPLRGGASR